jgi:hypothetical protein
MNIRQRRHRNQAGYTDPHKVRDEIAYMENRLDEIGHDGDCAYEKAMIRFFEQELDMRKAWLASYQVTSAYS